MTVYTSDTTLSKPTTAPAGSGAEFRAGVVTLANSAGLPSGVFTFSGGTLLVGVPATLNDGLSVNNYGAPTPGGLSAKHGVTATLTGALSLSAKSGLVFGGVSGADGVVVLAGAQAGKVDPQSAVDVRGGVVRIAGVAAQALFAQTGFTSLQQGATLDIATAGQTLHDFASLGAIVSSHAGGAVLTLAGTGTLGGAVTKDVALDVAGSVTVTGSVASTAAVEAGAVLQIGAGGSTGTAVVTRDDGTLLFDRSDAVTVASPISGAGSISQVGCGVLTLSGFNSFAGGVTVASGVLVDSGYGGLGSGTVTLQGGELVIGPDQTLTNALSLGGGVLAAAHGAIVGLTGAATLQAGAALTIGDAAHDGAVVLAAPVTGELASLTVAAGTFALGAGYSETGVAQDGRGLADAVTVQAGASLDLNGQDLGISHLGGAGSLINSMGGVSNLWIFNGDFSGSVTGAIAIQVQGQVALHGAVSLSGGLGIQIDPFASLTLDQATTTPVNFFHPVAPGHIDQSAEALVLGDSVGYRGSIAGMGFGDTIDFKDIVYRSPTGQLNYDPNAKVLFVQDGQHSAHITLVGGFSLSNFSYQDDGTGHVLVTLHG